MNVDGDLVNQQADITEYTFDFQIPQASGIYPVNLVVENAENDTTIAFSYLINTSSGEMPRPWSMSSGTCWSLCSNAPGKRGRRHADDLRGRGGRRVVLLLHAPERTDPLPGLCRSPRVRGRGRGPHAERRAERRIAECGMRRRAARQDRPERSGERLTRRTSSQGRDTRNSARYSSAWSWRTRGSWHA